MGNTSIALFIVLTLFNAVTPRFITGIVNPACECIIYESRFRSHGVFMSPNLGMSWKGIEMISDCFIYSFVGQKNEIVELQFFYPVLTRDTKSCTDTIRIFLDLEKAELNEESIWNYEFCSQSLERASIGSKHFSLHNNLLLEYHPLHSNSSGFKGKFKFHPMSKFEIRGGTRRAGIACAYDFHSSRTNNGGQFFSPRYPQNYPPSSNCIYVFHALEKQVVKLIFHEVRLENSNHSCLEAPDFVVIRENSDPSGHVIGHLCHDNDDQVFISSGAQAYVDFIADHTSQCQGFRARFEFIDKQHLQPILLRSDYAPVADQCSQNFTSFKGKSGIFTSHGFFSNSLSMKTCRYLFQGVGKERVQISFLHRDRLILGHIMTNDTNLNCDQEDSITLTTFIKGYPVDLGTFCANVRLPYQFMSSDSRFEITYTGRFGSTVGFKARFRFVTDFGIKEGVQIDDIEQHSQKWNFLFSKFSGSLPENHGMPLFFFAEVGEMVHVQFLYIDLNGVPSKCTEDYVEMSNFNIPVAKRKITRFCGRNGASGVLPVISSEGNFFRATFQSNDLDDAVGFRASYHFFKDSDSLYRHKTAKSGSDDKTSNKTILYQIAILTKILIIKMYY